MIIDFHAHIAGGKLFGTKKSEVQSFLADMDANQIHKSLLLPLDALAYQQVNENERIGRWVKEHPDRFAGLGTVFAREPKEAVPEMLACLDTHGLAGLKFHPWLQAFSPLESTFLEIAAEANRLQTMLFFHDGTPPYTEPFQIAEIASQNPDLVIVMGHTGLNDLWRESLLAANKYDNIWLCLSGCPHWAMAEVVSRADHERILWGSDYPLADRIDTKQRIRQIELLPVSDAVKEKILFQNAERLLARLEERRRSRHSR